MNQPASQQQQMSQHQLTLEPRKVKVYKIIIESEHGVVFESQKEMDSGIENPQYEDDQRLYYLFKAYAGSIERVVGLMKREQEGKKKRKLEEINKRAQERYGRMEKLMEEVEVVEVVEVKEMEKEQQKKLEEKQEEKQEEQEKEDVRTEIEIQILNPQKSSEVVDPPQSPQKVSSKTQVSPQDASGSDQPQLPSDTKQTKQQTKQQKKRRKKLQRKKRKAAQQALLKLQPQPLPQTPYLDPYTSLSSLITDDPQLYDLILLEMQTDIIQCIPRSQSEIQRRWQKVFFLSKDLISQITKHYFAIKNLEINKFQKDPFNYEVQWVLEAKMRSTKDLLQRNHGRKIKIDKKKEEEIKNNRRGQTEIKLRMQHEQKRIRAEQQRRLIREREEEEEKRQKEKEDRVGEEGNQKEECADNLQEKEERQRKSEEEIEEQHNFFWSDLGGGPFIFPSFVPFAPEERKEKFTYTYNYKPWSNEDFTKFIKPYSAPLEKSPPIPMKSTDLLWNQLEGMNTGVLKKQVAKQSTKGDCYVKLKTLNGQKKNILMKTNDEGIRHSNEISEEKMKYIYEEVKRRYESIEEQNGKVKGPIVVCIDGQKYQVNKVPHSNWEYFDQRQDDQNHASDIGKSERMRQIPLNDMLQMQKEVEKKGNEKKWVDKKKEKQQVKQGSQKGK